MRELFVYYRVRTTDASDALCEVRALHDELRAELPQLRMRLLRRPAESDGMQTWMETYALEPQGAADVAGVDAAIEHRIESAAARRLTRMVGSRHVEPFIPCA